MIQVTTPAASATIYSPVVYAGEAKGFYFFEADFPVRLETSSGEIFASGYASAQSDWMTEDWVPFKGRLEFEPPDDDRGYLVFERANPSGMVEHAKILRIPVVFPPR